MRKKGIIILMLLVLAASIYTGCTAKPSGGSSQSEQEGDKNTVKAEYHKISQDEAKKRMDEHENIVIVDVRQENEYKEGHIKDAVLVTLDTIGDEKPEALPDLNQEILVYCRSGKRSEQASRKLVALGYTNIYDFGGINTWPYETE